MTTSQVRAVRREHSKTLATHSGEDVLAIARHIITTGQRWVAYELVQHHPAAFALCDTHVLEDLGRGLGDWASVDTFACYLAGPAWQARQIPDSTIHKWARSPDRWWRRTALVATVGLNCPARGGHGDTARTLRVCRMLVDDRDDMVVKAMSWALRELSKRDTPSVRAFLKSEENLAPRVTREVRNKLTTGLKNP